MLWYYKSTIIRQVPEFGTTKHYGKAHGISSGWMICNDTVCCWPITSSNIFTFDHKFSAKGGLEVFDCTVQSAEYWCPYGTLCVCCVNVLLDSVNASWIPCLKVFDCIVQSAEYWFPYGTQCVCVCVCVCVWMRHWQCQRLNASEYFVWKYLIKRILNTLSRSNHLTPHST